MAKFIYVQLAGFNGAPTPQPLRIYADKLERGNGKVVLKLDHYRSLYKVDSLSEPVYFSAFPIDAVPTKPTQVSGARLR